ncbi:MAG: hypothetical protein DU429_07415 [Candidatus Tokpelaia sp.]|nr:MAG: hypothetical protein DU430_08815 [Candidatus Tokpelaia sp.]KAA6205741.1 MAG: hypothetical protein DU429_07415 [Candidatus Tokpelaia sp.]KAA6404562.1 hypothetical protein DPQ22_09290 [Candidatus Tokpelaia sp.]
MFIAAGSVYLCASAALPPVVTTGFGSAAAACRKETGNSLPAIAAQALAVRQPIARMHKEIMGLLSPQALALRRLLAEKKQATAYLLLPHRL